MTTRRRAGQHTPPACVPPHDAAAEAAVVGADLQDLKGLEEAAAIVRPTDFHLNLAVTFDEAV